MARRRKSHGCLYTLLFWPVTLTLDIIWWIIRFTIYVSLYLILFVFTLIWCFISTLFSCLFNWILHKPGFHVVCNNGEEYELACCQKLKKYGFTHIETTPKSGDHGIDILAHKAGKKYAIQCKYYSSPVGNHAVQEAYSGCYYYRYDIPVVLTNNTFTKNAIDESKKLGVQLWHQNKIPFTNKSIFHGLFKRKNNMKQYDHETYQQLLNNLGNTYVDTLSSKLGGSIKLLNIEETSSGYHMIYETDTTNINNIHAVQSEFNNNLKDHYIFTQLTDTTFSIDQINAL